jgi:hypothetical protein
MQSPERLDQLIAHAKKSIDDAYNNISKITPTIKAVPGYSGDKTKHLYNNMVSIDDCNYLEVGTYMGGSFVAAMYNNKFKNAYAVDNWSQFGGTKDKFFNTINVCGCDDYKFKLIDKDSWTVTKEDIPDDIDVYMYDGKHTYEDQKLAITHYCKFLAKYSIIMVDDWVVHEGGIMNWGVQSGTYDGITEMGLKVHYKHEIPLVNTNRQLHIGGDTFWNGCGIFVVERTDI